MNRNTTDETSDWMKRTPADEKASWMQTLRTLLDSTDRQQSASDRKRDLEHLNSVISKLHDVLSACAREGVEITVDENETFERAKRRVANLSVGL